MWMAEHADQAVSVPEGAVRVLVGQMGAGKSEQASRWWEEGLSAAQADPDVEIPVWFTPRQIVTTSLEDAVTKSIGRDPARPCRVVVDGLDDVPPREADRLLYEARQLVATWPKTQILATSRPGLPLREGELIKVDPWPVERGLDLVHTIAGDVGWNLWTAEVLDLLTSPLSALAVAGRLLEGRDVRVSRLTLLRDLPQTILRQHRPDRATPQLWADLARLAVPIISESARVRAGSFGSEAEVWQLTDTGLVVEDDGMLSFALPVFEQHFGAQALTGDIVRFEAVASPDMFPRWRYAVAFAVSTSEPRQADEYMLRLARTNPAAVSWTLDEIAAGENAHEQSGRTGASPAQWLDHVAFGEHDAAIVKARRLRDSLQALLEGFGSCRSELARHSGGRLVQWGVQSLGDEYIGLYEARETVPPPDLVTVPGDTWENRLADGWSSQTLYRYPQDSLGRWTWARSRLQRSLTDAIRRRRLPLPPASPLVAERRWVLAQRIMQIGGKRHGPEIPVADLKEVLDAMTARVNQSVRSTWHGGGEPIDSDDVRWMGTQLAQITGEVILPPRPAPDQPHRRARFSWQGYSPELTRTIVIDVLRDAVNGYCDLVKENFANFGGTLSLNSVLPVCVEGAIEMPEDDVDGTQSSLIYELKPDRASPGEAVTAVTRMSSLQQSTGSEPRSTDRSRVTPGFPQDSPGPQQTSPTNGSPLTCTLSAGSTNTSGLITYVPGFGATTRSTPISAPAIHRASPPAGA
jgi:hypothetical protein